MDLTQALKGVGKPVASKPAPKKKIVQLSEKKKAVHPGFKSVQSSIAKKEGVSKESAGAILASATHNASSAAKSANPNLKKVN